MHSHKLIPILYIRCFFPNLKGGQKREYSFVAIFYTSCIRIALNKDLAFAGLGVTRPGTILPS